jgi:hypothetical protein
MYPIEPVCHVVLVEICMAARGLAGDSLWVTAATSATMERMNAGSK